MFGKKQHQPAPEPPKGSGKHVVTITEPNGNYTSYSGMTTEQRNNTIRNVRKHPGYEVSSFEIPQ